MSKSSATSRRRFLISALAATGASLWTWLCQRRATPPARADDLIPRAYLPYLEEIPALAGLGEESLRYIAGGSLLRGLSRGQVLCEKGSRAAGFFCDSCAGKTSLWSGKAEDTSSTLPSERGDEAIWM